jgi:hypothetical protein
MTYVSSQINAHATRVIGKSNVGVGLVVMVIGRHSPDGQPLVVTVSHQEEG